MVIRCGERSLRRIVGGVALFAFLSAFTPGGCLVGVALAQSGPSITDVVQDFTMERYDKALAGADAIIALGEVSDADLATCFAFKGRCLLRQEGREKEAKKAFKDAHKRDENLVPDESWAPEERLAFEEALKDGGPPWLLIAVGTVGAVFAGIAIFGPDDSNDPVPPVNLPNPPDPPGSRR